MFSKRLEAMELLLARLPGVAPPITKSAPNCYADTPFTDAIALVEMPKKFIVPSMKMYDGTTDPDNHIAQYKQRMFTTAIAKEYREASMCKGFGSSLTGPALQWFTNLPNASIDSFASLTDRFVEQFASSRNIERTADDLYEVIQKRGEPLRDYVGRFNKEKVSIPACVTSTAISAFKRGLLPDSDLYKELTKYQCRTMEDVLSRAWAQIRWEEDLHIDTYFPHDLIRALLGTSVPLEMTDRTRDHAVKALAREATAEATIDHSTKLRATNAHHPHGQT
ncbi:unnamed protein product [Microthlaspi erraticum]|uniref:Retrotransposon gag domain-containing protein n=1 Tax=Microthlaspi erraticum TaxID=1685480 RepID=A0A6D2JYJ7_9BRAS|nr:unnamed protein product [Microthlaspi erraticum]